MNQIIAVLVVVLLSMLLLELRWSRLRKRTIYQRTEVLANLGLLIGNQLLKPLSLAWKAWVFQWLVDFRRFELPDSAGTFVLCFFVVEFVYYWYHRISHEWSWMWTVHHAHHSSTAMNLTTAIRLNWMGAFLGPLFFGPLILLGFPPMHVILCLVIGLLYQYFLHTEMVGRLGAFEGILLNTPSAHRVHHGSNSRYLDKNYGAVLIVFDRIFGTWQAEVEPVVYGVTTGPMSPNPFRIVFEPLWLRLRQGLGRTQTPSA